MTVYHIQSSDAFKEAITNHKAVLIDFFAVWCGPCKVIAPIYAEYSENEQYKDIHFAKIDVDELSSVADELDIQAMPTIVLFKDGKKVEALVDPTPKTLTGLVEKGL